MLRDRVKEKEAISYCLHQYPNRLDLLCVLPAHDRGPSRVRKTGLGDSCKQHCIQIEDKSSTFLGYIFGFLKYLSSHLVSGQVENS